MYSDTSATKKQGRPSLGSIEVQRRTKLHDVLRDVRIVLDAARISPADRDRMLDTVAPLVAVTVAEIAVLDRETDAVNPAVVRTYGRIIAQALDLHDEPWHAMALWKAAAPDALESFRVRWSQYIERATRESEGRHRHERLIDLEQISRALNLTRARIASIFGAEKCVLPPIVVKDRIFCNAESADIRALSQRIGLSPDWIRHLALTLSPEAFCDQILVRELLILPDMDKHRIANSSDVSVSRSIRKFLKPRKPGPAPRADTRTAQIGALARHRRVGVNTIKRLVADLTTWLETPEIPDSAVTVAQSSCHSGPEIPAVRLANFGVLSSLEIPDSLHLHGVTITDPDLLMLAVLPWTEGPRSRARRKRYTYADKDLVIAWWQATRNETPTADQIRQWAHRGHYSGYRNTALIWKRELELRDLEGADDIAIDRAA